MLRLLKLVLLTFRIKIVGSNLSVEIINLKLKIVVVVVVGLLSFHIVWGVIRLLTHIVEMYNTLQVISTRIIIAY